LAIGRRTRTSDSWPRTARRCRSWSSMPKRCRRSPGAPACWPAAGCGSSTARPRFARSQGFVNSFLRGGQGPTCARSGHPQPGRPTRPAGCRPSPEPNCWCPPTPPHSVAFRGDPPRGTAQPRTSTRIYIDVEFPVNDRLAG
jgi:hypothetical protein